MAKKFIITTDRFMMGNVGYHMDFLKSIPKESLPILGGGRWDVDKDKKIIYLWGASMDFGYAQPEQIKKAIESADTWISNSLNDFEVMHSPIISDSAPDEETFTKLLVLNT